MLHRLYENKTTVSHVYIIIINYEISSNCSWARELFNCLTVCVHCSCNEYSFIHYDYYTPSLLAESGKSSTTLSLSVCLSRPFLLTLMRAACCCSVVAIPCCVADFSPGAYIQTDSPGLPTRPAYTFGLWYEGRRRLSNDSVYSAQ